VARLRELLGKTRLVTLVGPGGVGKTRLAVYVAATLSETFPDGVWVLDLSSVTDPALVPQALGDLLGIRQQPDNSELEMLTRSLRRRRVLLVVDNCEHLVAACAELAETLLRGVRRCGC
jgi:predicted ATPase